MPHSKNFLLNRLDADVLDRLSPHLSFIQLPHGEILAETHERVEKVYFPHSGIISCVVETIGGGAIETGMIGNDGAFGSSQALDDKVSLNHVVMQVSGPASMISSDHIRKAADELPILRGLLVKYEQFFLAQVQQTRCMQRASYGSSPHMQMAASNAGVAGDDLPLTQEFLSQMMGVRRTSVTQVAGQLQKAGMITYKRGHIHINDLDQIREWACECDADVRSHYRRIFQSNEADAAD